MDEQRWRLGAGRFPLELAAVAGPVLLTAAWLVLGAVSPGYYLWGTHVAPYSAISQPISGLGLGETGPYMNAAFVISGLLLIVGAYGVFERVPEIRARYIGALLLALPGIGSVLDGFFTFQTFFIHFVGFGLALTTIATFPLVGFLLRRTPGWRRVATGLIVAGPLTAVLVALYFATFTPTIQGIQTGVAGLTERLLIIEIQAWYIALGWVAFRKRDQSDRKRAQATPPETRKHEGIASIQGEIQ
jgi:hypothetical protein